MTGLPDPDAIADASAWWLYPDEGFECWRLVPGSQILSPNGKVLRLTFALEDDRFELALVQREGRLFVKFDQRDDPEQELPAQAFGGEAATLVKFADKDETVFVEIEL